MAGLGRIVTLDIETTTKVAGVPEDAVPGLDPRYGAITDVGLVTVEADGTRTGQVFSVGALQPVARYVNGRTELAPPPGEHQLQIAGFEQVDLQVLPSEYALLWRLGTALVEATRRTDTTVAGWNTAVFDLPYIHDRMRTFGFHPAFELFADPAVYVKYAPLPGHDGGYRARFRGGVSHLDIQAPFKAWAEARDVTHSLKPVGKAAGYKPVEVDRERMHLLSLEERGAYVLSDADLTASLAIDYADELDLVDHVDQFDEAA